MFFRYFSESIDDAVDPKIRKLAVEKLRSISEDIKSFKDIILDEVRSDQTMGCNPSQQTHQSCAAPNFELIQMHSSKTVIKNDVFSPFPEVVYPDHVSSEDATSIQTHSSSEKRLEQITVSSKLRCSSSKNKKTVEYLSIIGNTSRRAMWKKVKASALKHLYGLEKSNLEKIASKTGIEVDWMNVGGTDTNGALMERVREGIIKEMDR